MAEHSWDVFISHSSEDKDGFVRPLAHSLTALGLSVWYDEFSLRLGESLSGSIDVGLRESRRGILVITPAFLRKRWPQAEYRALLQREVDEGDVLVPLWHGVSRKSIRTYSPLLADKVALITTGMAAADVALSLCREIRPELYAQLDHARATEMVRDAEGASLQLALEKASQDLQRLRSELSEFQCDVCGAPLIETGPVRLSDDVEGSYELFACGRTSTDAGPDRACPNSPEFPTFESFDFEFVESGDRVICLPRPESESGRGLELGLGTGLTREEAVADVRRKYDWLARPWTGSSSPPAP